MSKNYKYIIPLAIMLVLFVLAGLMSPEKTDWSLSFSKEDKKPYGSYIVYNILPGMFEDAEVFTAKYPVYNTLKGNADSGSAYIIINAVFDPDKFDTKMLLEFVRKGNNVFASANIFGKGLSDSLKIKTALSHTGGFFETDFLNRNLRKGFPYKFKNPASAFYFSAMDSSNTSVIGEDAVNRPDFIRIKLGYGNIYLNTIPAAFTNYNILDSLNAGYVFKALSYLPEETCLICWDEYYKAGKMEYKNPLQFITSSEALKWAYYILLFSIVFYIVFAGRRRQRIIPVIHPPANTTLEFVNTVGRLYYQQKDHKNIGLKKITYFLDQIRNRYFIKTDEITNETLKKIAGKSGIAFQDVKEVFDYIQIFSLKTKVDKSELHKINSLIESFYKKAGFHG